MSSQHHGTREPSRMRPSNQAQRTGDHQVAARRPSLRAGFTALAFAVAACGALTCGGDRITADFRPAEMSDEERALFLPDGPVVVADEAPPAIQGGTLLMLKDGTTAVASDPDRDSVFIADLLTRSLRNNIVLQKGDEPGRAAEDARGDVHVLLRGAGAMVTLDVATGEIRSRTALCHGPSGIAYAAAADVLHVVCSDGEWLTVNALTSDVQRRQQVTRDLRDVVVAPDGNIIMSTFRASDVLVMSPTGDELRRVRPANARRALQQAQMLPRVAWRMTQTPAGEVMLLHQRATNGPVGEQEGAYLPKVGCDGILQTTLSTVATQHEEQPLPSVPLQATTAVDVAVSPDGQRVAVAAPGNAYERGNFLPEVLVLPIDRITDAPGCAPDAEPHHYQGEVTAVAFASDGQLVVQSRQPAALFLADGTAIALSDQDRSDTGLALFHLDPGTGISCASCHPAGREDGHVWKLRHTGPRRTQTLAGTLANTAPYHWNGDMHDLGEIFATVFEKRMFAAPTSTEQRDAFAHWLTALPSPAFADAPLSVRASRGRILFNHETVGCASCHSGPRFTNNTTVDVGSGGPFQVPSLLGVADRAPFMHYGCADTLAERFGPCGGFAHGNVDHLDPDQLGDLIAYLESL